MKETVRMSKEEDKDNLSQKEKHMREKKKNKSVNINDIPDFGIFVNLSENVLFV